MKAAVAGGGGRVGPLDFWMDWPWSWRLVLALAGGVGVGVLVPLAGRGVDPAVMFLVLGAFVGGALCAVSHPLMPAGLWLWTLGVYDWRVEGWPATPGQLAGAGFLLSCAGAAAGGRLRAVWRSWRVWLVAGLAVWLAGSAWWSHGGHGRGLAPYPVLYALVASGLAGCLLTRGEWRAAAWVVLAVSVAHGAGGLWEAAEKGTLSAALRGEFSYGLRIRGTAANPITFGWNLVYGLPVAVALVGWERALAAALSTASGLLLVLSSSLAHDIYYRLINPQASEAQRVRVGRYMVLVGVVVAGAFGIYPPGFVAEVVSLAFGLAAASFFPVILLGIFDVRMNKQGAITGMVAGLGFTLVYIVQVKALGMAPWLLGISPEGAGVVGMLLNFALALTVSRLTPPPPEELQEICRAVRRPETIDETDPAQENIPAH